MQKTNIKILFIISICFIAGVFSVNFAFASDITPENVIRLVNEERIREGLAPLSENSMLSKAAKNKAVDMIENDYFAHTSPKGVTPWFWIEKEGYKYVYAGENLAINFKSAEKQNESLMKSPTHRKNILSPNYNEIGVAVVTKNIDEKESIIMVQEFGYVDELPVVYGEATKSLPKDISVNIAQPDIVTEKVVKNIQHEIARENIDRSNLGYMASIISIIGSVDYLRLMKYLVIISSFVILVLFFSSIAHKFSEIKRTITAYERRLFRRDKYVENSNNDKCKAVMKEFSMDIRKIKITHLDHMKQRE